MSETGADKKAGMPERPRKVGDGIAEETGIARQTDSAHREDAGDWSQAQARQRCADVFGTQALHAHGSAPVCTSRTAGYGTVRPVVWELGGGNPSWLPDEVLHGARARVGRVYQPPITGVAGTPGGNS